jgi:TolB-like protein
MKFFSELRRRNVIPTLLPYAGLVWLILQVLSVLQPMFNIDPLVSVLVSIILFAGFPVVAYLSWYFNVTMHGLESIPDSQGNLKPLGWKGWSGLAAIGVISLWLGFEFYIDFKTDFVKQEQGLVKQITAKSIAVLPFRDQSPEKAQAYLAEGVAEELTSLLGKVSELQVAASSSSFALAAQNLSPAEIGRRLGVDAVLSGSIRVSGTSLKLRTELVNVADGMALWTESFSRNFTDIFALEEEVSRSVVNLLQDRYLADAAVSSSSRTESTDAYVAYLKGREQYRKQTTEGMKAAREWFQQALALDPEYTMAYIAMADTAVMLADTDRTFGQLKPEIAFRLAEENLAKALTRKQDIAEAYAVRGVALLTLQSELDGALDSLNKALALNPSLAVAHMWRFRALKSQSRHKESMQALTLAYKLDPVSVATAYNLGFELTRRGQFEQAENIFRQLTQDFPDSVLGYAGLAHHAFVQGELAESIGYWQQTYQMSPGDSTYKYDYMGALLSVGLTEEVRAMIGEEDQGWNTLLLFLNKNYDAFFKEQAFQLEANPDNGWLKFEAGWYHLLADNKERGNELLLEAYQSIPENEWFTMPMCSPAIEFSWVLQQQQRGEEAQLLIETCTSQLNAARDNEIIDSFEDHLAARIAALNGEPDKAIEELQRAIDNGWREWWTAKDPLLSDLKSKPPFQTASEFIEQQLKAEKQKALGLLSGSSLPSSPESGQSKQKY